LHSPQKPAEMPALTATSARAVAGRLLSREMASATSPNAAALAAHAACERSIQELHGWLGTTGSELLLSRALTQARASRPALADIQVSTRPRVGLSGVPEAIQRHGSALVAEGLEAVLLGMVVLLIRVLGDKMTTQLLESKVSSVKTAEENPKS